MSQKNIWKPDSGKHSQQHAHISFYELEVQNVQQQIQEITHITKK